MKLKLGDTVVIDVGHDCLGTGKIKSMAVQHDKQSGEWKGQATVEIDHRVVSIRVSRTEPVANTGGGPDDEPVQATKYVIGEPVDALDGDLYYHDCYVTAVSESRDSRQDKPWEKKIRVRAPNGQERSFSEHQILPRFKEGDRVVVLEESHHGERGYVLQTTTKTQHARVVFDKPTYASAWISRKDLRLESKTETEMKTTLDDACSRLDEATAKVARYEALFVLIRHTLPKDIKEAAARILENT